MRRICFRGPTRVSTSAPPRGPPDLESPTLTRPTCRGAVDGCSQATCPADLDRQASCASSLWSTTALLSANGIVPRRSPSPRRLSPTRGPRAEFPHDEIPRGCQVRPTAGRTHESWSVVVRSIQPLRADSLPPLTQSLRSPFRRSDGAHGRLARQNERVGREAVDRAAQLVSRRRLFLQVDKLAAAMKSSEKS